VIEPMIRKDKEINDPAAIERILREAPVLRIALAGDEPYIVPVNFACADGIIYVHSARRGKKIDMLRRNGRVCFQTDLHAETAESDRACQWGMKYLSVIGAGEAFISDDEAEKRKALGLIMEKYSGRGDWTFEEKELSGVLVIKIRIDSLTGKRSKMAAP